nr:DGQHR domain-containing protein [uncultured Mucilaginibacter sp.]
MNFQVIEYNQNSHKFISAIIPFKYINNHSHVLIYDKDEGGYQREPDTRHINNIKKYILDTPDFLFPTSIILGIDEENYESIINRTSDPITVDLNDEILPLFRIVDGQHRLRGLAEASRVNNEIYNLQLSVVILLTPHNVRSLEMEIFNTINSKSKRIKVDLIQLARYEYRILENNVGVSELNEHISMQIANLLNEDDSKVISEGLEVRNVWYNAIKFGIHDEQKVGIIGVSAFIESLRGIVNKYLQSNDQYLTLNGAALISYSKDAAIVIKAFINDAWNNIIYKKWPGAFSLKNQELDYDQEIKEFYYNNRSYIQKTLGTKSLNYLLSDVVNQLGFSQRCIGVYQEIIERSPLITSDWEVGRTFSGYSSESAFNKVTKIIRKELPLLRN